MSVTDRIVFPSLLIGLLSGVQPVSVEVPPGLHVSTVLFSLDGREVGRSTEPPWSASIDFGQELRPHELVSAGLASDGREVARAARSVNTPQAPARLDILLERDGAGRVAFARMFATSVRREVPIRRQLKLDRVALRLDESGRASLPALDLAEVHVLSGIVDFSADAIARSDLAFGGAVEDEAGSRLTAVPVRLRGGEVPTLDTLRSTFRGPRGPVTPVAIERGEATILFVRDPINMEAARRLGKPNRDYPLRFDGGDHVGLVWPVPQNLPGGSARTALFESVGPFDERDLGYHWLLSRLARTGKPVAPPYRFADAVAVAGLQACGAGTRRVVVLVEGEYRLDGSQFSPEQVEGYLASVGVPLRVWSLLENAPTRWKDGHAEDISSFLKLSSAVMHLKEELNRQRVVWVAGDWAPGSIALEPGSGLELVR
jgi:hypothetical protein